MNIETIRTVIFSRQLSRNFNLRYDEMANRFLSKLHSKKSNPTKPSLKMLFYTFFVPPQLSETIKSYSVPVKLNKNHNGSKNHLEFWRESENIMSQCCLKVASHGPWICRRNHGWQTTTGGNASHRSFSTFGLVEIKQIKSKNEKKREIEIE